MPEELYLRPVEDSDLPFFFEHQVDPEANFMAAFTHKDPSDRAAFDAHWAKTRADPTLMRRTIVWQGRVAGSVSSYGPEGQPEVTYWLGREFWGKGLATEALRQFLREQRIRPIHG